MRRTRRPRDTDTEKVTVIHGAPPSSSHNNGVTALRRCYAPWRRTALIGNYGSRGDGDELGECGRTAKRPTQHPVPILGGARLCGRHSGLRIRGQVERCPAGEKGPSRPREGDAALARRNTARIRLAPLDRAATCTDPRTYGPVDLQGVYHPQMIAPGPFRRAAPRRPWMPRFAGAGRTPTAGLRGDETRSLGFESRCRCRLGPAHYCLAGVRERYRHESFSDALVLGSREHAASVVRWLREATEPVDQEGGSESAQPGAVATDPAGAQGHSWVAATRALAWIAGPCGTNGMRCRPDIPR